MIKLQPSKLIAFEGCFCYPTMTTKQNVTVLQQKQDLHVQWVLKIPW